MSNIAKQLEQVATMDLRSMFNSPPLYTRLTGATLITPGSEAVWSLHDIARHLLSLPDEDIREDYEGMVLRGDLLPAPKIPAESPVWSAETKRAVATYPQRITPRIAFHER